MERSYTIVDLPEIWDSIPTIKLNCSSSDIISIDVLSQLNQGECCIISSSLNLLISGIDGIYLYVENNFHQRHIYIVKANTPKIALENSNVIVIYNTKLYNFMISSPHEKDSDLLIPKIYWRYF